MAYALIVALGALALFAALLVLLEVGGRLGKRALARNADATMGSVRWKGRCLL